MIIKLEKNQSNMDGFLLTIFIHFWISVIPEIAGSSGFKHDSLASVCGHALKVFNSFIFLNGS